MPYHKTARGGKVSLSGRNSPSHCKESTSLEEIIATCGISKKYFPPVEHEHIDDLVEFYTQFDTEELIGLDKLLSKLLIQIRSSYSGDYEYSYFLKLTNAAYHVRWKRKNFQAEENKEMNKNSIQLESIMTEINPSTEDITMENKDENLNTTPNTETDTDININNSTEPPAKKRKKKKKKQNAIKTIEDNSTLISANSCPSSSQHNSTDDVTILPTTKPKEDTDKVRDPPSKPEITLQARYIKVLVRGLPVDFDTDAINTELQKNSIETFKIVQFKKRMGEACRLLPLFLIILTSTANHQRIFEVNNIQQIPIKIERFRGGRGPIQCYNCQNYGHTQSHCNAPARCVKCAENHRSHECNKDRTTPPKCCNCYKSHTANYTGCETRPSRRSPRTTSYSTPKLAHRLVSLIKELQELLKNEEVLRLLREIIGESSQTQ
ncbi:uncharacterized protein [Parasteatoda tepidariorum]|uniref:uncharacterized protein n=1 Tax=Parasteatoda tepidariorum TaxID=114398 RepID=UPI0039BC9ED4